jgi:hypothetical protein
MASKATSERRRGLHKALLIAAWLATVLVAGPVLAQEEEVGRADGGNRGAGSDPRRYNRRSAGRRLPGR